MANEIITREEAQAVKPVSKAPQITQLVMFDGSGPNDKPVMAMVKHGERGLIRSMQVSIPLSVSRGEIYPMAVWSKDGGRSLKYPLTAQAYYRMNQFGGVTLITPDTVVDDEGKTRPNPYLHRESDEIKYVRVRKIGVGRNATGNLVAYDYTLTYSLSGYLAQDLMSKYLPKGKDATPKRWGILFPAALPAPTDAGVWNGYSIPGGLKLWANVLDKEVISIVQEHLNRQRFCERNAITIAERNVLKRFYGVTQVEQDKMAVKVIGWPTPDRDFRAVAEQAMAAKDGRVVIDGEEVNIDRAQDMVEDPDDINAAIAGDPEETGEEGDAEGSGGEPPVPGVSVAPTSRDAGEDRAAADIRSKIRALCEKLGPSSDDVAGLLSEFKVSSMGALADLTDVQELEKIRRGAEDLLLKRTQTTKKQPSKPKAGEQGTLLPDAKPPTTEPHHH